MSMEGLETQTVSSGYAVQCTRPGFIELMQSHAATQLQLAAQRSVLNTPNSTPLALVASEFDAAHYLAHNEDVRLSTMEPLEHFMLHGADELRNPNAWFDTGFYVRTNSDVVDADINPFWHYLAHGKAEGRKPNPQRQAERATLALAVPASARWVGAQPVDAPRLAYGSPRLCPFSPV